MNRRRFCLQRGGTGSQEHISQGSAATYLKCDGIIKYDFVANLPLSLSAKEFWKSVDIWGSYGQEFSVLFFRLTVYISLSTLSINSSFDDVLAYQLRVTVFAVITSLPLGEAKYCDDRVCLFVCLSVRSHISTTTRSILSNLACYLCPWLRPPVQWRRCDASVRPTSSFMDDVLFGLCKAIALRDVHPYLPIRASVNGSTGVLYARKVDQNAQI